MNAVYRLIFSRATGQLQVASEIARAGNAGVGRRKGAGTAPRADRAPARALGLGTGLRAALRSALPLLVLGGGAALPVLAHAAQQSINNSTSSLTITGSGTSSVIVGPGGTITGTLTNEGTIRGSANTSGISISGSGVIATLSNSGSIGGKIAVGNSGKIDDLINLGGTIAGTEEGFVNLGSSASVGTLVNASVITGAISGIENNGTIATLSNSGALIIGGHSGIANAGYIGNLINSGTVSGNTFAGLRNAFGSIGTVTNVGTISGAGTAGTGVVVTNGAIEYMNNTSAGSITGVASGIFNDASIGTLSNYGVISAKEDNAIENQGTIGQIINGGLIQAGSIGVAIRLGGAGTTLTNTGTIIAGSLSSAILIDNNNPSTLILGAGSDIQGAIDTGSSSSTILMNGAQAVGSNTPIQGSNSTLTITSAGDVTVNDSWTLATVTNDGTLAVGGGGWLVPAPLLRVP